MSDQPRLPPSGERFDLAGATHRARRIRLRAAGMVARHGFGYLGQALSSAELISVLCSDFWRPGRDHFVLSPGHYVIAAYAVGVDLGMVSEAELDSYGENGSGLEAIGTESSPVVDMTFGSLGQGLSCAVGIALADRLRAAEGDTYALLSDGEMQEGQVWEAAMFAAHHRLERLTAVIDCNDSQVDGPVSEIVGIEPLADKWASFGWEVVEADGHDPSSVFTALSEAVAAPRPAAVIARTSTRHGIEALPEGVDGHFIKLPPDVAQSVLEELRGGA